MAPSSGMMHTLVTRNLKVLRLAAKRTTNFIQHALAGKQVTELQPIYARVAPKQPIHPSAFARQSKRWISTNSGFAGAIRRFTSASGACQPGGVRYAKASFPVSRVATSIAVSTGRAPFASTLRPNLTGGAMGRTAGGYSTGAGRVGGARYFSHGPASTGQVVANVSQAVRAFIIGGHKAQYDGVNPRTGNKRYKSVTELQEKASRTMSGFSKTTPGSFIDFEVNPTITALTPLSTIPGFPSQASHTETLGTEGLLDVLSIDFSRQLKELAVILNDLKKLTALGDLPITYQHDCLRIHFPGCDADTVNRLTLELSLQRGIVGQDPDFDEYVGSDMALLFPFPPSKPISECSFYEKPLPARQNRQLFWPVEPFSSNYAGSSENSSAFSTQSNDGAGFECIDNESPWVSSLSGYDSLHTSEISDYAPRYADTRDHHSPLEYSGIEGIYRFLEQCDAATARRI